MTATRDRIVNVALDLFYQQGFHAVGVDHIAQRAETTRTTLYNHFPSKDDLVLAVVEKRDRWWRRTLRTEMQKRAGPSPVKQLYAVFEVLRDWFATHDFNGCLFVNCASAFPLPHEPAHKAARANIDAIRQLIAEVAQEAGIEDAQRFAQQFNIIVEGAIVTEVVDCENTAADTAAELARLLIDHHLGPQQRAGTDDDAKFD